MNEHQDTYKALFYQNPNPEFLFPIIIPMSPLLRSRSAQSPVRVRTMQEIQFSGGRPRIRPEQDRTEKTSERNLLAFHISGSTKLFDVLFSRQNAETSRFKAMGRESKAFQVILIVKIVCDFVLNVQFAINQMLSQISH